MATILALIFSWVVCCLFLGPLGATVGVGILILAKACFAANDFINNGFGGGNQASRPPRYTVHGRRRR